MRLPLLGWIVVLLGESPLTRETFIQIVVYQNALLLLGLLVWLLRRLKYNAEHDPTLPIFCRSTKPETRPIMILVTKSVTTKVEVCTQVLIESHFSISYACHFEFGVGCSPFPYY